MGDVESRCESWSSARVVAVQQERGDSVRRQKRLKINSETVRRLTDTELTMAAGGSSYVPTQRQSRCDCDPPPVIRGLL
jgi:hypothetical protein